MTAIEQTILTSGLTIFGAIFVLVFGEVIKRAYIEPINEQKQLLVEIAEVLVYYSHQCTKVLPSPFNPYGNPPPPTPEEVRAGEASATIRKLASRLRAKTQSISWYRLWRLLHIAPDRGKVLDMALIMLDLADSTPAPSLKVARANYDQLVLIDRLLSTIYHTKKAPYPYLLNTSREPVPTEQASNIDQSERQQ